MNRSIIVFYGLIGEPVALVITLRFEVCHPTMEVVSRWERFVVVALPFERFQFRCDIKRSVVVIADIEWDDPDGVAGYQVVAIFLVVEHKGEDAVERLQKGAGIRSCSVKRFAVTLSAG